MGKSNASRMKAYRQRQKEAGLPDSSRKWRRKDDSRRIRMAIKPFVGCDGEGCGVDDKGRQNYMLLRIGPQDLYTGKPLSTRECLEHICNADAGTLLVGFSFGYDVTMILRDLSPERLERVLRPVAYGPGRSRYTWYEEYGIEYLPKQYFRVCKMETTRHPDGTEKRVPITGSTRTIWETFGFYQKSFLTAIEQFGIGTVEGRKRIAASKSRRSEFTEIGPTERAYCKLECEYLEMLMEKLREHCHAGGIHPRTWNGAGKLSAALHKLHHTPTRDMLASILPDALVQFADMAYYGGRFEITRTGPIGGTIYEYDIHSAYPAAMRDLPCVLHGKWTYEMGAALRAHGGLYVAAASFRPSAVYQGQDADGQPKAGALAGLPVRSSGGHLFWPLRGKGVYWSPEIESARALGFIVTLREGWCYHKQCDCKPFDWIEPVFEFRKSLGSSTAGYPIKLGVNGLYGKLAQRIGNGLYHNLIWAGLITAYTRAKLNDAIRLAGHGNVVMLATDGVYSITPIPLEIGEKLGQWETKTFDGLFIVQPGLYWSPNKRKLKSRGLSPKLFEVEGRTEEFENVFQRYADLCRSGIDGLPFPSVGVEFPFFTGLKIALARKKPETAGRWTTEVRQLSFNYLNKRQRHVLHEGHLITFPITGDGKVLSLPHRDFLSSGGQEAWEKVRAMLEEQPDYIDMSPPFED